MSSGHIHTNRRTHGRSCADYRPNGRAGRELMNRVLAAVGIGLLAFVAGALVAVFGTWGLASAMVGMSLDDKGEFLFQVAYIGILVAGLLTTVGLSWFTAPSWSPLLPRFVAVLLLGGLLAFWVPVSSQLNDCALGLGWPIPNDVCD